MAEDSIEPVLIDREAWELAFKPYGNYPNSAYDLARVLMKVKQLLETHPPNVSLVASALDAACEVLFPLTEFSTGAQELYRIAIEGRATKAHEDLMDGLGIKY